MDVPIWVDRVSTRCWVPLFAHPRSAGGGQLQGLVLSFWVHTREREELLVPSPLLSCCGRESTSPHAGRKGSVGIGERGHQPSTAWDRCQLMCVTSYKIKVNRPSPTHFSWCQQQDPSAGTLTCTFTWALFYQTPQNIKREGKFRAS